MDKNVIRNFILEQLKQQHFKYETIMFSNEEEGIIDIRQMDSIDIIYKVHPKFVKIQANIQFHEQYIDLLMFPTPNIVKEGNEIPIIIFFNYVNRIIKAFGHFYIDEYNDIAYALRINNEVFINNKEKMMSELIEIPLSFYEDICEIIMDLILEKIELNDAIHLINKKWS
ncbi:hypothetical protein J9174_02765 [Macrococcoides canis]|uniref:hypothetical protein n=1 Tax=Macrococcoides canis TaxID=1855823 RepID=UPI001AEC16E0|nr:hypothetical protein [Macrococcus canis]QTQ08616.1 hypothetical protein J9174_02765 [Macrococcus canis]